MYVEDEGVSRVDIFQSVSYVFVRDNDIICVVEMWLSSF